MRKIATLLISIFILTISNTSIAFEADFSAKIRDVNTENNDARVISTAQFKDTNIQNDGTFTISYSVTDNLENIVFSGSASIDAAETEVKVGNRNIGKITIKHDIETGIIKTRFVKKVNHDSGNTPITSYNITATSGSWNGEATINSRLTPQVIVYPEQITIEGRAISSTGVEFFITNINVSVNGVEVYSEGASGNNFSITVNTNLDDSFESSRDDIQVEILGAYDGGALASSVLSTSISPNQSTYNFGNINLSDVDPQTSPNISSQNVQVLTEIGGGFNIATNYNQFNSGGDAQSWSLINSPEYVSIDDLGNVYGRVPASPDDRGNSQTTWTGQIRAINEGGTSTATISVNIRWFE